MNKNKLTYFWILPLLLLVFGSNAMAQLNIKGSIGVDLNAIGSVSESNAGSYSKIDGSRFISNHFLNLSKMGVLKNDNFAKYNLNSTFNGYFSSTNTGSVNQSFYNSPSMNNLNGDVTFFPNRTYPLNFFYYKMNNVSLKYSEGDRSKTDILSPSLAALQKNRVDNTKYGSAFSTILFEGANFNADFIKNNSKNLYLYDFEENRKIYISSTEFVGDIFSPTVRVIFSNNISDDSVRIISGTIDVVLPPDFTMSVNFDTGFHHIDIIPLSGYTQSAIDINMKHGQLYRVDIDVDEFPTRTDNIKESTESNLSFDFNKGTFNIKTSYDYENSALPITNSDETNILLSNSMAYDITRKYNIVLKTEKSKRTDDKGELGKKVNDNFKNSTVLSLIQRRGLVGEVKHEFVTEESKSVESNIDKTVNNTFGSGLSYPSNRFKHKVSLRGELTNQEKTGQTNSITKSKSVELSNSMELNFKEFKIIPYNSTKMDDRTLDIDTSKSITENLSITTSLEGSKENVRYVGDFLSKIIYAYSDNIIDSKSKVTKTISYDIALTKRINEKHSISFSSSHSWKSYGGDEDAAFDSVTQQYTTLVIPTEYSSSNTIIYSSNLWEDFDFTSNYIISNSPGSKTTNYGFLIDFKLPIINVPFNTEVSNQIRELDDIPKQTSFKAITATSYNFNQMVFSLSYEYSKEKLVLDTYTFYEFKVNILRSFNL